MCYGPGILRFCNKSVLSRKSQLCGASRLQPDQQERGIALGRKCALSRAPVYTVPTTWPRGGPSALIYPSWVQRRLTSSLTQEAKAQIQTQVSIRCKCLKMIQIVFSCLMYHLFMFIIFITFIYGLNFGVHSPLSCTHLSEKRFTLKLTVTSSEFSVERLYLVKLEYLLKVHKHLFYSGKYIRQ